MTADPIQLRFYPWLRRGLSRALNNTTPAAAPSITYRVTLNKTEIAEQSAYLRGPAHVTGLAAGQIIRQEPAPGTPNAEPNLFACVEFAAPELPWLFTPAAPTAQNHLRPWLALVVVEQRPEVRLEAGGGGPLPVLTTPGSELPDLADAWAWAHVQVTLDAVLTGDLEADLAAHPEAFVARLISPRNMRPDTAYLACVVPTFEGGRQAGLGAPIDEATIVADAWTPTLPSVTLPVYHSWRFTTGPDGDFELLARRLLPVVVRPDVGLHDLDISDPDPAGRLPATPGKPRLISYQGALTATNADPLDWPANHREPFKAALRDVLNTSSAPPLPKTPPAPYDPNRDDPVLAPPIYGTIQSGEDAVPAAGKSPVWLRGLNLDPTWRTAAALGREIVQRDQESLMASAWQQARGLSPVNRFLRQTTLAAQVNLRLQNRILAPAVDDAYLVQFSQPAHARLTVAGGTIRRQIRTSPALPVGTISPAFRRVTRLGGVLARGPALASSAGVLTVQLTTRFLYDRESLPDLATHTIPTGTCFFDDTTPSIGSIEAEPHTGPVIDGSSWPTLAGGLNAARQTTGQLRAHVGALDPAQPAGRAGLVASALNTALIARGGARRIQALAAHPAAQDPAFARTRTALLGMRATLDTLTAEARQLLTAPPAPAGADAYRKQLASGLQRMTAAFDIALADSRVLNDLTQLEERTNPRPFEPRGGSAPDPVLLDVAAELREHLDPLPALRGHVQARISAPAWALHANTLPDRIVLNDSALDFPDALYARLVTLNVEYFMPGYGTLPDECVGLLAANREFVEAFLVGANHELSREFLWREYPADLRGTWFSHFWTDTAEDIDPIRAWQDANRLGANGSGPLAGELLILLVRGELLRRYPDVIVYAARAGLTGGVLGIAQPEDRRLPLFDGTIASGVRFYGFALSYEEAYGTGSNDGFFFVLEQHPTEPLFGLDEAAGYGLPYDPNMDFDDFSWGHLADSEAALDALTYATPYLGANRVQWAATAAQFADRTLQRPVQALIHATRLLPPPDGG